MRYLDSLLDLCVVTSPASWQPSARVALRAIHSAWSVCGSQLPCRIYADRPQPWLDDEAVTHYWQYVKELRALRLGPLTMPKRWHGYSGQLRRIAGNCHRPTVMLMEHDWEFIQPRRVDIDAIMSCLLNCKYRIRVVRFAKLRGEYRQFACKGWQPSPNMPLPKPLTPSGIWASAPHFATAEFYETELFPRLKKWRDKRDGRLKRFQRHAWEKYKRRAKRIGRVAAAVESGIYYYGKPGDKRYLRHDGRRYAFGPGEKGFLGDAHLRDNGGVQSGEVPGGDN